MALTNFLVTAAAIGAAALMLGGDVRRATTTLRRNVNVVRSWLAEAEASGSAGAGAEAARRAIGDKPEEQKSDREGGDK